jgi:hypothetical protein
MPAKTSRQSGQILIIFALLLTALLGFAALAIDGGMIFANRRYSQSVSDTAALAGAGAAAQYLEANGVSWANFSCSGSRVITSLSLAFGAAQSRATSNQISDLDGDLSDNHGIEVICVDDPGRFERYIDVHTKVTSLVSTSFVHLFFPGMIKNTVDSVVRIHPRTELAFGYAIVSLSDLCGTKDGGVVFDGNNNVKIEGGGVFSNSCIKASGTVDVAVTSGGVKYTSTYTTNGGPLVSPAPGKSAAAMPRQVVDTPACGTGAAISSTGGGVISPGNYSNIKLTNGTLTLNPGLYCLSGDMDIQGGEILGDAVTIYLMKDGEKNTNVSINGGATVHLNAPTDSNVVSGGIVGILFYMQDGNEGNISLLGNSGSSFAGAVYAPDGDIDIGGTGDVNPTYNTQIVGKYVKVHGNAKIDIKYQNGPHNVEQPKLDVME